MPQVAAGCALAIPKEYWLALRIHSIQRLCEIISLTSAPCAMTVKSHSPTSVAQAAVEHELRPSACRVCSSLAVADPRLAHIFGRYCKFSGAISDSGSA